MDDLVNLNPFPFFVYRRWIKVGLARAVNTREDSGDPNFRRWTETLPALVKSLNDKSARGTSFRRADVRSSNFPDFLNELYQTSDHTLLHNLFGEIDADRLFGGSDSKKLRQLFKFPLGAVVLVHRSAYYQHGTAFSKPSIQGSFRSEPARVKSRWLKRVRGGRLLVPGKS